MNTPIFPQEMFRIDEFPQAIVSQSGTIIHVAAQGALDAEMNLIGGDSLSEQARQAWNNIDRVFRAAGASGASLVSSIIYLVGMDDTRVRDATAVMVEAIRSGAIPAHANTMIGVTRLPHPGMLIEISAVGVV